MHTTLRHSWRASVAIIAVLAAITALTAFPSSAAAADGTSPLDIIYESYDCNNGLPTTMACSPRMLAGPRYIGWTYLNNNYCPPGMACIQGGPDGYLDSPAWRWSGTAWSQTTLSQGWVYVYPYTGQWRWAWTQRTGWVAISGGRFDIRLY